MSLDEMSELGALLSKLDSDDALHIRELEGFITGVVCTPGPDPHHWRHDDTGRKRQRWNKCALDESTACLGAL
jgi:hypothetical protein